MEFQDVFVLVWCLFLPTMTASQPDKTLCSNDPLVINTQSKPEGKVLFPSTTFNYTAERCHVEIRSPLNSETELTLINLRQSNQCYGTSSVEILYTWTNNYRQFKRYCKSVGSVETLILKSPTIKMVYRASIRSDVHMNSTKDAISIYYKRTEFVHSTKATKPKTCRHVLRGESGTFQTYGYPTYPLGGECEWIISTDKSEGIILNFHNIMNIHNLNCQNNYIEVRQGDSIAAPLLAIICKPFRFTRKIESSSSKLWIRIKSSSTNGIGFQATYKPLTCMVVAADTQLDFESPTKISCMTWNLTAPPGNIAAVSFTNVNLESTDKTLCSGNVLEVWDGKTKTTYCNQKLPPPIITSKGRKLVVTYRLKNTDSVVDNFQASFTSISPSSFKTNCFVQDRELSFKCDNQQIIPCAWKCDGAMQCSDNSDENLCSGIQERWHKLQLFVIVMGSICASTVIFCVGLVCFRKCIINDRSPSRSSSRRSRHLSLTDQSPLTPNADLPSPPPCYFTDRDEEPPASVIRGTYFFGDEFSQSSIHSASLFGIPPPRYRSTESLHQSNTETRSIWQRGISSIPLMLTDNSRNNENNCLPEEDPPDYDSLSADKDECIIRNIAAQHSDVSLGVEECIPESPASSSNEVITDDNDMAIELQTPLSGTTSPSNDNRNLGIGITNAGATINI